MALCWAVSTDLAWNLGSPISLHLSPLPLAPSYPVLYCPPFYMSSPLALFLILSQVPNSFSLIMVFVLAVFVLPPKKTYDPEDKSLILYVHVSHLHFHNVSF